MPVVKSKVARRVAACAAVAFVSVAFTAACGSKDDSSNGTSNGSTGQNGGGNSAFAAYTECLSKNGVTITMPSGGPGGGVRPSGGPGGAGFPSGQPRPSGSFGGGRGNGGGGFPGGGGFQKPEGVDDATWTKAQEACASVRPSFGGRGNGGGGNGANAAFNDCLKKNGVTDTASLNTADAATKKAIETCKVLQPAATATS
ncbi:hypothetical protein [Actinoplanes regularis]|uniref:PT repeat-containing protein n=1 Tax=Actinoplanes regularis TaxID=52697 RepID=A0A239AD06_9ACTN|nr:hypothetical protein [Actinoplanes regularis]GIE86953.1 hypothetical protein Are01nite_34330 [Actinoplanes regularis]SNR92934.1 hypothetical protein SAMN06264365_107213 [Actinoplanes regularis]